MAVRNIRVIGDRMEPRRIYAGTRGSYITEVAFTFSGEWDGLTKKLIFYPVRGKPVYINYTYGSEKIPYEVMRYSGDAIMLMSGYSVEPDGSLGDKIVTASAFVAVDPAESDTQNEPDIPEATEFEKIVAKLGAPYIGENGNWFVWDVYTHEFVDTGLPARGEQGETGRGLTILGKYGSLDDLRASVKDAQPGDAYAVGEKAPYTIYIWDDVSGDFTNHGDLRGVGITKIEQITDNTGSGEPNTIRIVTDDGADYDYTVYNGERGHPGNIWIGETEPPDDSYTIWMNPGGAVSGFLESHQGTENAGRVLVVDDDGIVRPGEYAGGGGGTITQESDPTVPAWAKQPQKPKYTAKEVGALSESELDSAIDSALAEAKESGEFDGEDGKSGVYVGGDPIPSGYNVQVDPSGESVEFVEVDAGLTKSGYAADAKVVGDRFKEMAQEAPVQSVNGKTGDVKLSASDVGADASGTADSKVSAHNTSDAAHNDIRQLISDLTSRLNALADSDDTTLDQMSELVAYIKSNKSLIDSITTNKVNVEDIIDNLTTSVSNKPLSAKMGVELKKLIDAIKIPTTLPASDVYSWAKQPQKPKYTAAEVGAATEAYVDAEIEEVVGDINTLLSQI